MRIRVASWLAVCCVCGLASADEGIGGGHVLIAPMGDPMAYLIDADGQVVHQWDCQEGPANATYLLEDGSLLRTAKAQSRVFNARGGAGGRVKKISWDGELLWDYTLSNNEIHHHHDVEPMPNGNVLAIVWERHTFAEAVAAGRDPNTMSADALWTETILELKPKGRNDAEVVWKWRLWDHLVQQFDKSKDNFARVPDHPELVDINYGIRRGGSDWIHMNSVDYNAELDQIALSARWFDEAWIIDHSTTTGEAAGHAGGKSGKGGDLLYRWGNPEAYYGGFPFDRQFFAQHDVRWIDEGRPGAGNFLLFNNGDQFNRPYSSVDEFASPVTKEGSYPLSDRAPYEPQAFRWSYSDEGVFRSDRISGAQRLPNGNTLICCGESGWVFAVTPEKKRVWEFRTSSLPGNRRGGSLFRAPWHAAKPDVKR
ncbi:MAG: aryl-sulfate sulfotransferase [Planctomycetaceae bacterium]|nr:aryl-sulfate sulfotransferase [Planctomycetaceae bacterium]